MRQPIGDEPGATFKILGFRLGTREIGQLTLSASVLSSLVTERMRVSQQKDVLRANKVCGDGMDGGAQEWGRAEVFYQLVSKQ